MIALVHAGVQKERGNAAIVERVVIGIAPHRVVAADIDETPQKTELPRVLAMRLAHAKASAVPADGGCVLAADTVVALGRRILPKAETEADARRWANGLSVSCMRPVLSVGFAPSTPMKDAR